MNFTTNISRLTALLLGVCIFITVNSHAQSFLTNGLVAYYPFNGNANDMAGINNGVSHSATLTSDRFGNPILLGFLAVQLMTFASTTALCPQAKWRNSFHLKLGIFLL